MGELQDRLGHLVFEFPEGWMQAHQFANHRLDLGDLVLGQVLGEAFGEMVGREGVGQEVLVEKHPALARLLESLVQQWNQRLAGVVAPAPISRPSVMKGRTRSRVDRPRLRILQPGLQNRQSVRRGCAES